MTELPDALRLAAWFESFYKEASIPAQAAAELRRLHALNQELLEALKQTLAQCLVWQGEPDEWSCSIHKAIVEQARFAITKATGETN